MQEYQQRVVDEKNELDTKIVALTAFVFSGKILTVGDQEVNILHAQLSVMASYSRLLADRISYFS